MQEIMQPRKWSITNTTKICSSFKLSNSVHMVEMEWYLLLWALFNEPIHWFKQPLLQIQQVDEKLLKLCERAWYSIRMVLDQMLLLKTKQKLIMSLRGSFSRYCMFGLPFFQFWQDSLDENISIETEYSSLLRKKKQVQVG